jgi:hypothetical protein
MTGQVQSIKQDYRTAVMSQQSVEAMDRISILGEMIWKKVGGTGGDEYGAQFNDVLVRFNQGWIVARVMKQVPDEIPYAGGETLLDAAIYSVIPRALSPEKPEGASQALFGRYTGIQLPYGTAMGLGVLGELYANFGPMGGIIATFIYGSLIGILFFTLIKFCRKSVFWWALIPIIVLPVIEPGWNLEDTLNHVVKAGILVFILIMFIPGLKKFFAVGRNFRGSFESPIIEAAHRVNR